ncbi:hypothetical protein [Ferrimicrobium sp.]|uniref:hypothetical protein n=1 Tax=Ferrimicrobium sp. TaxID=2926050 RepID=UPI0026373080|nr:hypothetical protein [Ferrimicrobium sp.]
MRNPNTNGPGYPETLLRPTNLRGLQPIALIHLDAEAEGVEGFDEQTSSAWLSTHLAHERVPAYYRYTVATTGTGERLRIRGLVIGLLNPDVNPPLWIAVDNPDIDAILVGQGSYLGNVADADRSIHRLERYEGTALDKVVADIVSSHPAITVLDGPQRPPADIAPVFITSFETAASSLRPARVTLTSLETATGSLRWLTALPTSSDAKMITDVIATYHRGEDTINFGLAHTFAQRSTTPAAVSRIAASGESSPGEITCYPTVSALRALARTGDPDLCFPASILLGPSALILAGSQGTIMR